MNKTKLPKPSWYILEHPSQRMLVSFPQTIVLGSLPMSSTKLWKTVKVWTQRKILPEQVDVWNTSLAQEILTILANVQEYQENTVLHTMNHHMMTSIISARLNKILLAYYLSTYSLFFSIYQINLKVNWYTNDKFPMETDKKIFFFPELHSKNPSIRT